MAAMMKFVLVLLAALVLIEAKSTRRHCSKIRGRRCGEDSECACLNRHNATLICNYNYTCEKRTFIDDIMRRQPCHRIYKKHCLANADCPCSEAPLICEDNECVKKRPKPKMRDLLTEVMRNQPCPGVFKSSCSTNADCPCSEARLICEDNECVKRPSKPPTYRMLRKKTSHSRSRVTLLHKLFKTAKWLNK